MLQLSHFKLLAGVVFALFVLTACGGGGDAAAPAAGGGGAAATTVTSCTDANQHVVNNACVDYTKATCETASKHWNGSACVADNYAPKSLAYFDDTTDDTDEYSQSKALAGVNAAPAYVNIEALIDADNNSGAITQAGGGQMISLVSDGGFNTSHQEFTEGSTAGAAFDSVLHASATGTAYTGTDITSNSDANCASTTCYGTEYASLIAGRKGGTEANQIHGIAYNAKINAITLPTATSISLGNALAEAELIKAINAGVGSDIIAMNHVWEDETVTACYSAMNGNYYRPMGTGWVGPCGYPAHPDAVLETAELEAWRAAVNPNGNNNTIMVFGAGDDGLNSETGITRNNGVDATAAISSSLADANVPDFRASYPALYADDSHDGIDGVAGNDDDFSGDFTSDRWLVVTGLDENDVISTTSNGCGVAMGFCLAAPGRDVNLANDDGTANAGYFTANTQNASNPASAYASSTVAGALAVLKGAFPNATPEKLTELVLDTATYLPLTGDKNSNGVDDDDENGEVISGSTNEENLVATINRNGADHKYNAVYGYGKLNLEAATTPSTTASYVTASNNTSIGALWKDTQLTLSSHFGSNFESVKFGIGDAYGRHFITAAPQTSYAPVTTGFDEYMGNMLADNVQSETLGGQAKLNYSNSGQPWMNLEYTSGKATSKIAFQDNYKISPLNDNATTSILRANHIRPASQNIGMMDVDYQLSGALSLSSYAARGEYDTGYKFDELGTDFDVNYKKSHLNIAIGNIREHDQFLGTHTTGGYALNAPTVSRFTDVTYGHDVGNRFNIYANYINYETDVDMLYDQFASIDGLQADQYQVGFTGKSLISDDDNLNIALITKLGVTDGALNQNTTLGYTADGGFNDVSQSYDLAVSERHQQFEITYQGKIYQNSQDGVSVLKDNRFFTTIRVDQNLNHVQGASQTEIVTGMQAKF